MQSEPLFDRFGRRHSYLRISVTDRCNLRCVYCMPEEGVEWKEKETLLTYEEILRVAAVFAKRGVDKVRLTGGEPTVRKGITNLIRGLSEIGFPQILMTTNGTTLERKAGEYREAGLTGLNVSLDTLRPDRFQRIARREELGSVLEGIDAAINAGFVPLKVNMVVMRGMNDDEMTDFVERFADRPIQIRFIEFMPFTGNRWSEQGLLSYREMLDRLEARYRLAPIETDKHAVAKEFSVEGQKVTLGFVTSMTESFCDGCNRIRLTADGNLKACLFANAELPLRDPMRAGMTDEGIEQTIELALRGKQRGHAPANQLPMLENRSMVQIGG